MKRLRIKYDYRRLTLWYGVEVSKDSDRVWRGWYNGHAFSRLLLAIMW